jgi:hypothetical protein
VDFPIAVVGPRHDEGIARKCVDRSQRERNIHAPENPTNRTFDRHHYKKLRGTRLVLNLVTQKTTGIARRQKISARAEPRSLLLGYR